LTAGALPLAEINTRHLQDQSIRVLFTNHHLLEEVIKSQGSNKNISSELKTREVSIPVKVDVSVCSHQGKIESIIYIVKSE
jgi:hypothetical protein